MKSNAIVLVLLVSLGFAQSKPKAPSAIPADRTEAGRFHMVAVKAPGRSVGGSIESYDELFLYDTATGRVWRYEPSSNIGDKGDPDQVATDPYFTAVIVENLHGDRLAQLQAVINLYAAAHTARVREYCKDHPLGTYKAASTNQANVTGTDCTNFLKEHPVQ